MIAISVIGGVGALVGGCLQLADAVCAHKRNVRILANRIKLLIPLIEEVKLHHEQVSATVTPTFERLEEVLKKAHDLFAKCKNASRLYLVANSLSITEKFKDVTAELDGVMSMLPMALLSVSSTIKEQVQVMRQELHGVQYIVEEGISTLSKDVAEALQAQKSKASPTEISGKLKLLAKELHLTSREELEREAKALLEEKRAAHNKHAAAEEEDIERVLELVKAMDKMAPPEELICPISRELMKDPVFVACGQSYDRDSIEVWFRMGHNTDPLSGQLLEHNRLTPNYALKSLISNWKQQHGWREGDVIARANSEPSAPPMAASLSGGSTPRRSSLAMSHSLPTSITTQMREVALVDGGDEQPEAGPSYQQHTWAAPARGQAPSRHRRSLSSAMSRGEGRSWAGPSGSMYPEVEGTVPSTEQDGSPRGGGQSAKIRSFIADLQREGPRRIAAAMELKALGKGGSEVRASIVQAGAVGPLIEMLHVGGDSSMQEAALGALLNLSVDSPQKAALVEGGIVCRLGLLLHMSDVLAVKEAAAVLLFSLSTVQSPEVSEAARRAIDPLAGLLSEGTPGGRKDALKALFNTSIPAENKAAIVSAGVVPTLLSLVKGGSRSAESQGRGGVEADSEARELAAGLLGSLAQSREGSRAISQTGGVRVLAAALEAAELRKVQEHAAAILLLMCNSSSTWRSAVARSVSEETLQRMEREGGTPRAQEKASKLLAAVQEEKRARGDTTGLYSPRSLIQNPSFDVPEKPSRETTRSGSELSRERFGRSSFSSR